MSPFRARAFNRVNSRRRSMVAKVHIAQKQLGLNEDDYRAILVRITGHSSTAMMNEDDLDKVLSEFEAKGFSAAARPAGVARPADHPSARKARAMWISLHQLGAVANASEKALEAFARRQLGVDKLQWADQSQCYKLVEALKAMADRAGWSQDLTDVSVNAKVLVLKRRLVALLRQQLVEVDLIPADWPIERAAWELGGIRIQMIHATASELDVLAATFAAKRRLMPERKLA